MSDTYLAGTASILPELLPSEVVADQFYPQRLCSNRINALAKRVCGNFGIKERAVSIDMDRIPEKILKDQRNHPLEWCVSIIEELTGTIAVNEIGYLGVAYNTTLHTNNLPNLACQAAMRTGMKPEIAPDEFANYGCAGGRSCCTLPSLRQTCP